MRKFLPSKKFIFVIGGAIVLVLATFTATSFFGSKGVFQSKNKMVSVAGGDRTIGDIVSLDSNGNGIPDWEEKLWGLDPKGNGSENKKIIDDKKASANIDVTASPATELTETQKFSRELLTTVSALRVNGSLTPEVIGTLEQSLDIDLQNRKTNTPTYSADSFKTITNETPATYQKYHAQFKR
jgi:hypothetical protein